MTEVYATQSISGPSRDDESAAAAPGIAKWLSLAATPSFAIMALLAAVLDEGPLEMLCSAQGASPLGGMVPMYVLMAVFHAAPWLKMISSRQIGARRA